MIYKDEQAYDDSPRHPNERYEDCLHCGEGYNSHHGWACDPWYDGVTRWEDLDDDKRYLTQSMKDSIAPKRSIAEMLREKLGPSPTVAHKVDNKPDLSDWRTWAQVLQDPSHCACGIHRDNCTYHRR